MINERETSARSVSGDKGGGTAEIDHLRRFRLIFESAVDFAIIATDRSGLVTDWNSGAERILGWSADEMRGQPLDRFFTPEDRDAGRPEIEMRIARNAGQASDERWHLRQDGSRFWASGEMMPLKDDAGILLGYSKMLRDMTQARLARLALSEAEEMNDLILGSSRDCIVVLDLEGITQLINPGGLESMEASDVKALFNPSWLDSWKGPDREAAGAAMDAARSGGTGRFQGSCPTQRGTPKWWDVVISSLLGPDGKPLRLVTVARDISTLKQAENRAGALVKLGDRLRDLENADDLAYSAAEILGQLFDVSRVGYGTIDPLRETISIERDWNAPGVKSLAGVLNFRDYGSYIDDLKRGETVVITDAETDPRTAATADALKAISARSVVNMPVTEHGGFVAMLYLNNAEPREWSAEDLALVREIAERTRTGVERRRAEQNLKEFAATLEARVEERTRERDQIWRASRDLIVSVSSDGYYRNANPAWTDVFGHSAEHVLGAHFNEFVHPDDRAGVEAVYLEMVAGKPVTEFEARMRTSEGIYRLVSWVMAAMGADYYASGRDITDQRAVEEQLRQSQKMEAVGQLTGGLAHDFNNLLTGITGSLELLQARIAQGRFNDVDRYVRAAHGASNRAAALTHRLLAFSRRQTLAPKPTNVNRLVAELEDLVRRTVGPAITVEVVGAAGLWTTLVDPNQLENAVLNLCINARDAMPEGGRLTIETANKWLDARAGEDRGLPPGQYLSLCVTDSGTGMTPDVIARAFDPFFTTKPLGEGTGLGLSMIYGFARQSGGQVRIYSEVGEGTTVCLYLPRHLGALEKEEQSSPSEQPLLAEQGETVLVVDDEPTVRMLITDVLEDLGYTAIEAPDGAAGLKVLESGVRIDLLVTDVGLPGGMNGRQMADAGRRVRPDLKVLFITGYAENAVLGNGHLEHGMHIMTKPFAMDALASRIKDLTSNA